MWVMWAKAYRSPDERNIRDGVDDSEGAGFLLLGLSAGRRDPAEDDRVDGVCSDGEDNHGEVARAGVQRRSCEDETEDGDELGGGDVPCALIEAPGLPGPVDGDYAGDKVGRAGQDAADYGQLATFSL